MLKQKELGHSDVRAVKREILCRNKGAREKIARASDQSPKNIFRMPISRIQKDIDIKKIIVNSIL